MRDFFTFVTLAGAAAVALAFGRPDRHVAA
jgi:hypothetical protein